MERLKKGDRVRLVFTWYESLASPGMEGTVLGTGPTGTIHVDWDNGSHFGIVPASGDRWEIIERSE